MLLFLDVSHTSITLAAVYYGLIYMLNYFSFTIGLSCVCDCLYFVVVLLNLLCFVIIDCTTRFVSQFTGV